LPLPSLRHVLLKFLRAGRLDLATALGQCHLPAACPADAMPAADVWPQAVAAVSRR